jgi:hypothetical protein
MRLASSRLAGFRMRLEFLKEVVAFIVITVLSVSTTNATLPSHHCGLCVLSAAGVEKFLDREEICHAPVPARTDFLRDFPA